MPQSDDELKPVFTVERGGDVALLRMDAGENRFNRTSIDAWHTELDALEAIEGPFALVTTGTGKFYSNGLDLDWLLGEGASDKSFLNDVERLLVRVLDFPAITVAAVNGHAFAAGAMLASAHDIVIMREDRGFWCLPEVDLGLPLTATMFEVVAAHLPGAALRDSLLTGRRFPGPEALSAGIAHELASEASLVSRAMERALELAHKDRGVIREHKRLMRRAAP
ncbi:MAG: enoyl-CoA hydratase/isomerase family protein [Acidimicrobiales bacterium]|jgi:enoyl-CoA hydratase/carnithine racemase